jgi:hypothetical protein
MAALEVEKLRHQKGSSSCLTAPSAHLRILMPLGGKSQQSPLWDGGEAAVTKGYTDTETALMTYGSIRSFQSVSPFHGLLCGDDSVTKIAAMEEIIPKHGFLSRNISNGWTGSA